MKAIVHPILVLETCTRLVAYLVAWTIRAHRHLVRIESEFIRVPNSYALEAAALRRWRGQDDPAAAFLLHIFGGSPPGVHLTLEEMRRWIWFIISGLGIAEGIWALHFSLGGRADFHLVCSNATHLGGPLHNHHLIRRLQELAQQATEDLNTRRLAAGLLPIGCLTIEGRVYYPDLRIEILKVPSQETAPRLDLALPTDNMELPEVPTPEPLPVRPVPERTGPLPPINDPTAAPRGTGPANEPPSSSAAATAPDSAATFAPELPSTETAPRADLTPSNDDGASPEAPTPELPSPRLKPKPTEPLPEKSASPVAAGVTAGTKAPGSSNTASTPKLITAPPAPLEKQAPSPAVNWVPRELPRSETPDQPNHTPTANTVTSPKQPPVLSEPEPTEPLAEKSASPIAAGAPTGTKATASTNAAATDGAADTAPGLLKEPPTSQPKNSTAPATPAAKPDSQVPNYEWERRIRILAIVAAENEAYESARERRRREEAEKEYAENARSWTAEARHVIQKSNLECDPQLSASQEFIEAMNAVTARQEEPKRNPDASPPHRGRSDSRDRS